MKYIDYTWDLSPESIILDEEINFDQLGWHAGDLFELKNTNGLVSLVKLNPLVALIKCAANEIKNNEE